MNKTIKTLVLVAVIVGAIKAFGRVTKNITYVNETGFIGVRRPN